MEQANLLMSAKIHFVEKELRIIHLPLRLYMHYLPIILQLLFEDNRGKLGDPNTGFANKHDFLNVSITPLESSIVCEHGLATALFAPALDLAVRSGRGDSCDYGSISTERYVAMSVEGAGMEAGQRVLEVTSPLAMAGISIFFITTYTLDYILVPASAKGQVVRALEDRGFAFERNTKSYVNPSSHHCHTSYGSEPVSPSSPPPATMIDLQSRTFALLERHTIVPRFDDNLHLVQCASRTGNPETYVADELALQHGLTRSLIHQPKFLSVTMAKDQSASLLLEKQLVANFDMTSEWENVLLGAKDDILIPISLDLEPLGIDATGIVCGVAGKLVEGPGVSKPIEMTYLSCARSGFVILNEMDLIDAMQVLGIEKVQNRDTRSIAG